jgi:hypothetical protein
MTVVFNRFFFCVPPDIISLQLCSPKIVLVNSRGSVVVKALCYKPEGRGFDTR